MLLENRRHLERPGQEPWPRIEALEEAKDLQPENRPLLHKMLAMYEATQNWPRMIDTIQAVAEMEKDPIRKSKFIFTIAQLYRDKENDQERAVELFNEALDLNPQYLEAFERINKILTQQKDWKALERAFRKMLRRLSTKSGEGSANADLEFNLWHNLGLIYRDRLSDINTRDRSVQDGHRYKGDEPVERQILAELYEQTDQLEAAIGEHAQVLQKDPLRVDPYRSLYKLALKMHDYDRAWCMCSALAFLHKADEEEQRFFEDYRPRGMIQVKSRLDNEQWVKNLFHKDENIFIGKIFEMVTPAAIVAKTQALAKAKQLPALDRRFKQGPRHVDGDLREDVRLGPRRCSASSCPSSTSATTFPVRSSRCPHGRRRALRVRASSRGTPRRSSRSSSVSTSRITAASTTSRTSSRRSVS